MLSRLYIITTGNPFFFVKTQEAPVVTWNRKIYMPGDYPSIVDHYQGDQKTMVSKSKSLVPPF